MPKNEGRTADQIRTELAAERAALSEAIGQAREELKQSARLVSSIPIALASVTFVVRLFVRRRRR